MALILPFLLAFAGGATDLARAYQAWLTIESAARNAAEYVATNSADATAALTDARHVVCQESQHLAGLHRRACPPNAINNCTSPVVTVPSFAISTTQTGRQRGQPDRHRARPGDAALQHALPVPVRAA